MKRLCLFFSLLLLLAGCASKENTARTRFWQAFTARYNTYFNGHEAYKTGLDNQYEHHKDDYTRRLPFFPMSDEQTQSLGKPQFETAITKSEKAIQLHSIKAKPKLSPGSQSREKLRQYLQRKEFNPFLKNAWLLMGKAQFMKGDFIEAASTFSYITRLYAAEPEVLQAARVWLARCYAELDWFYDAEDVLDRFRRDTIPGRLRRDADDTMADLLLRQERFSEALPYLQRAARHARPRFQRARLYYLLAQVQQQLGNNREAYRALRRCRSMAPPYELDFNAQILKTEVFPDQGKGHKALIGQLRRMARSDKNKDYLDQVYYAIGNLYLSDADTAQAIRAYERGRVKATRTGPAKGVLLLRLGGVYWDQERYDHAQECYNEALSMLDKDFKGFEELSRRSSVLSKLVPYTSAVHLQDSLQQLARMDEADRNAAIDRVIAALVAKEKAEARARADSAADARAAENGAAGADDGREPVRSNAPQQQPQAWYFYNPMLVMQGKQDFAKRWGQRKNEDNWRRSNKTVVQMDDADGVDYDALDSIAAAEAADSTDTVSPDSVLAPEDDPHQREYYLRQIPFTEEQLAASDAVIMDGLHNAGVIEKDDLEDFPLAARTLGRVERQYPSYEKREDVLYQLYLLYSRWGRPAEAEQYRLMLTAAYPESTTARRLSDPEYPLLSRYGRQMEDSLYTAAYEAYLRKDNAAIEAAYTRSTEKFPDGANRPRFMLIHALSQLTESSTAEQNAAIVAELRELVKQFPGSDVSEMAGMIVNGLEAGRTVGGAFTLGGLWDRRTAAADSVAADSASQVFSADREAPFVCLAAYPKDSLNDNQLLYDLAHFNFSGFYLRQFEIDKVYDFGNVGVPAVAAAAADSGRQRRAASEPQQLPDYTIVQFRVRGFRSYDEAHRYAQDLYTDPDLAAQLRRARVFLISEHNLSLIPSRYSYADYDAFFQRHFAPLKLNPDLPLDENVTLLPTPYEDRTPTLYPVQVKPSRADSIEAAVSDSIRRAAQAELERLRQAEASPAGNDADAYDLPAEPVRQPARQTDDTNDVPAEPARPEAPKPAPERKEEAPKTNPLLPTSRQTPPPDEETYPADDDETYPADDDTPAAPAKTETPPQTPQKAEPAKREKEKQSETPKPRQEQPQEDDDGGWYPAD